MRSSCRAILRGFFLLPSFQRTIFELSMFLGLIRLRLRHRHPHWLWIGCAGRLRNEALLMASFASLALAS